MAMLSVPTTWRRNAMTIEKKGKEEYLYSAFIQNLVSRRSDMDHTVLPANYTMPAFLRKRSPDGASTAM